MTDRDALRRAEAEATPAPWEVTHRGIEGGEKQYDDVLVGGRVECMAYCYGGSSTLDGDRKDADLALIVEARNALPALLDELEQAEARAAAAEETLRKVRALADEWQHTPDHYCCELCQLTRALGVPTHGQESGS